MNLLSVHKDFKFLKKELLVQEIIFLFSEISNPNLALLLKPGIFNPRNTEAPAHSQIRNIHFPKWNYIILL
jgi:hypothetical protein